LKIIKRSWRRHLVAENKEGESSDVVVGLTGTFTLDPLIPFLGVSLIDYGFANPGIINANYNQVIQSCLNPASAFGGQNPEIIVVVWRLEDIAVIAQRASVVEASTILLAAVKKLCSEHQGLVILALPTRPRSNTSEVTRFANLNAGLSAWHEVCQLAISSLCTEEKLFFIDLEEIVSGLGMVAHDERKRLLYRQPYAEDVFFQLSSHISRLVRARTFEAKKCLVVDCDNTLWGGVIGEDGLSGIALGDEFPGLVYREVQDQIKALGETGVFIAVNSKNNPDDVWEAFDDHDGMILTRNDISSAQINWQPKSENLKNIASELNIGLDALVFMDDSEFEIAEVQQHVPEVTCLLVPKDLEDYPGLLSSIAPAFDRLVITEDDLARVNRLQGESSRREIAGKLTEKEFLGMLDLKAYVYEPQAADLARVTQLINKTNQFNCTTKRYTVEQVTDFIGNEKSRVYCLTVSDKFGDYGLVGVAIMVCESNSSWLFETLLLSCRVLGRGIETAFISEIATQMKAQGVNKLRGRYIPTRKNVLVADLYRAHGFDAVSRADANEENLIKDWEHRLPLSITTPSYIDVVSVRPS
jgi:FkbH-like protein